tara:strand:- start:143 stop:592 length:450 start_codon:yes stop_codon:yes gene_type:complete
MNHCLIQAVINSAPQMRYTKESKTPIAEMTVNFKGLRDEDPTRELKVLGWGAIAQEMVEELKEGQNIVVEGRLRMNSVTREDGTKEKQTELTASRIHHISPTEKIASEKKETNISNSNDSNSHNEKSTNTETSQWDSSPLVPEVDEIPF